MQHRAKLLAGVCGLLLSSAALQPAMAAAPVGFAGTIGGSYGQTSCDGCDNEDIWNINGSAAFGFSPNFGGELDAGYTGVSGTGFDINLWGVGGSVFWAPGMGRAGATVQYSTFSESGFSPDFFSYGVFGEYFASPYFTLAAKGGGLSISGSGLSESGGYIGAALIGYPLPNLAITPAIEFMSVSDLDVTNYGISAEYLISETVPISVFAGYTHSTLSAFGSDLDGDQWMIGFRFYTNGNGSTLVERHRQGTLGWAGSANFTSFIQGL